MPISTPDSTSGSAPDTTLDFSSGFSVDFPSDILLFISPDFPSKSSPDSFSFSFSYSSAKASVVSISGSSTSFFLPHKLANQPVFLASCGFSPSEDSSLATSLLETSLLATSPSAKLSSEPESSSLIFVSPAVPSASLVVPIFSVSPIS